ncbi:hypothetical protein IEQ34_009073 [Dendrobium chrysotoxum]|uniref:Uncharacterized protein n=1 Tax=Dendrobium chrysotoxum TaxID=161865 RepID=A0AAV7H1S9_DENCH|nr:hypothetical protein IEQ34_009073 [Dendrobium chrysotoxum]
MRIEKTLDGMHYPSERRVVLATFLFDGEAGRRWLGQQREKFQSLDVELCPDSAQNNFSTKRRVQGLDPSSISR